jgi:hypothetical protein
LLTLGRCPKPQILFCLDPKKYSKKIKSKLSFHARQDFFFPAHDPGYPPKILPSTAGSGYFDRPSRFSPDGEVGEFFFFTLKGLYYNSPGQRPGENALVVEMAQSMGVEMCTGFMRHNGKRQIGADYKFHGGKMLIANSLSMGNGITNPVLNGQDCKS